MLRFFIVFIVPFLFVGCTLPGVQDESTLVEDNTVTFENDQVSMLVPKTWSGKTDNFPPLRAGSVIAAFISGDVRQGFANNLLIISDDLVNVMTSKRYSEFNNLQTKKNYYEYSSLKEEDMTFSDNEITRIYVFEARYNETTPKMKFIQAARVCGTKVYLLHFTLSPEKKSDNYISLMKTFTCK
ncbi:MAG: hypothetical protein HHAS10_11840 [Candidatus Altimarinota bacterium]